jgi:predicted PurR-regulated permease PerM
VAHNGEVHGPAAHGAPAPPRGTEGRPQWIAIPAQNARRTTIIVLLLVVALWIGAWMFSSLGSFFFLLLLAWLLSVAMEPPVLWFTDRGFRRGAATGIVMLAGVLLTGATGVLFGQVLVSQAAELGQQFPTAISRALDWVNSTFDTKLNVASIQESLDLTPDKLGEFAGRYGGGVLGVFGSVLTFVFDLLTILVFAYYLSADSPRLRQAIGSYLPPRYQRVVVTVWAIAVEKTGGFVISKLVLAALSAAFHILFFWLIDVPFWFPLGLLAGIVGQFIPAVGTYIGVILPALFTLLDDPINAVWIAIFATVYQQLENYVFTPKVSKQTMNVHPGIALGAVFVGAGLFGPIGALIGIPVAAAILTILETYRAQHELLPELAALEDSTPTEPGEPSDTGEKPDAGDTPGPSPEGSAIPTRPA